MPERDRRTRATGKWFGTMIFLVTILVLLGIGYLLWERPSETSVPSGSGLAEGPTIQGSARGKGGSYPMTVVSDGKTVQNPSPSPPGNAIPASVSSTSGAQPGTATETRTARIQKIQAQRKRRYGLSSVDEIVTPLEPFKAAGREWTIDEIRKRIARRSGETPPSGAKPILRPIHERDLGSEHAVARAGVRKPVPTPPQYYGIRIIRPGENIWDIHYAIIREYLARRHIVVAPTADEPRPDGRSSGIGRLLKFLEGVVYVYDLRHDRLVRDLNRIYPNDLIVFFKISELFDALDHLHPEDFHHLRFLRDSLCVDEGKIEPLLEREELEVAPPEDVPRLVERGTGAVSKP